MNAPCESITKDLFRPCENLRLRLKVVLGSKNSSGYRKRFISEFDYKSDKYRDMSQLACVQIETDDFFVVETFVNWEARQNMNGMWESQKILFSYKSIHQLAWALDTAYSWLVDPSKMCVVDKTTGEISHINPMCQNYMTECATDIKFGEPNMRFTPTIKSYPDGKRELAVLVTMGPRNSQVATLTVHELAAWIYFMQHFDMMTASIALVNQTIVAMPMIRPIEKKTRTKYGD